MKVQSAGRLGNQLFQWAFALDLSISSQVPVTLFSDNYHSEENSEMVLTRKFLSDERVILRQSNLTGLMLVVVDWISNKSDRLGRNLKKVLRISDEWDGFFSKHHVFRGYFQNSEYVLRRKFEVVDKLQESLELVRITSAPLKEIEKRYPKYQLIHVRLGDYVHSDFGIVSADSYRSLLISDLPVLICTNGEPEEVVTIININGAEVLDSSKYNGWETLVLMQNAELFIGVNSTLSWWGAFLCESNGNSAYLPDAWSKALPSGQHPSLKLPGVKTYKPIFI